MTAALAFCAHPADRAEIVSVERRPEDGQSDVTLRCGACGEVSCVVGYAPQPGPQAAYFASEADFLIYGGAAGGGKTNSLIVEPSRYFDEPQFNGIVFRRTSPQLTGQGGVWDEMLTHYPRFGGVATSHRLSFRFARGARMRCSHLQHEADKLDHQGKSYTFVGFDELPHFTESQFWYLVSRLRTLGAVRPYLRATCNPVDEHDPVGGWVRRLVDWWVDPKTGLAIPERSGVLRWFLRVDDSLVWADSAAELLETYDPEVFGEPRSFTFIAAKLSDNRILTSADPSYRNNLLALPRVERERLLGGNWNVRASAGSFFRRDWFRIADRAPTKLVRIARGWDLAATRPSPENPNPAWTRGVKMGVDTHGTIWILDVVSLRGTPGENAALRKATAKLDGVRCVQAFWQDPGQAGKDQAAAIRNELTGYSVKFEPARESKEVYWGPWSTAAENGRFAMVAGEWNGALLSELEAVPNSAQKDHADAGSRAFREVDRAAVKTFTEAMRKL